MRAKGNASTAALVGIWKVLATAFVVTVLFVGRELLIPLALAAMLTFLLSGPVGRIEKWIGRIAATLLVVLLVFSGLGVSGWFLTRQVIDVAAKLPDYQTNIEAKLHALKMPTGSKFTRLSQTVETLKKELPVAEENTADDGASLGVPDSLRRPSAKGKPIPVRVVESQSGMAKVLQGVGSAVLGPLGHAGLVLLLLIFMLLKREDLRGRVIRLIGQGHISTTTRAMDDAGRRVSRYLAMQLIVNVGYGICVGTGLFFIGVPNPILWGAFAAVMRFIPYVGPLVGAVIPLILSFAVSSSWMTPVYTLGMFLVLELINANALEPWLYGSSTGVSSIALILAAVFWTWLWGPVGLLLSTPLTVCLAVMGRHVPSLRFLSVLLSEEQALAPHEECYHRLLAQSLTEASELAEAHLKANSLTALYDGVLIPALILAENDARNEDLDAEQQATIHQQLHDIIEDLGTLPPVPSKVAADVTVAEDTPPLRPVPGIRVRCLPARAYRDELAGIMLTQVLNQQGFEAESVSAGLSTGELVEQVRKAQPEAVCISVVSPSTLIHARYLAGRLRAALPDLQVVVGVWAATENLTEAGERLRSSGADEVVVSLAEAVMQLSKNTSQAEENWDAAPIPPNETERLAILESLKLIDAVPDRNFDRITAKLTRLFEVPIALITLIDRDHQWFKAETGLPPDLAEKGSSRDVSVCGHVVASNDLLVVEDLARDRRFASNPLLKERGLRFYAGTPIRINGLPIGSVCILDTKPRRLTDKEKRVLEIAAEDVVDEISRRYSEPSQLLPSAA